MNSNARTLILVDPKAPFSTEEIAAVWNAHSGTTGEPIATVQSRPRTFDAALLALIGNAADFIAIAGFVGVPTLYELVRKLREGDAKDQGAPAQEIEIEIDEEVIERPDLSTRRLRIRIKTEKR